MTACVSASCPGTAPSRASPSCAAPVRISRTHARQQLRPRRGFTLWEMTMVFAVLSVTALFVLPAWICRDDPAPATGAGALSSLLTTARRAAIDNRQTVQLYLDPVSGAWRADTTGVQGTGLLAEGTLELQALESLETEVPRVRFQFFPTGAALGDTVLVRSSRDAVMLSVDPWSGVVVSDAR